MNEIDSGIYRLAKWGVNLYLCVEEDSITLIDAGWPRCDNVVWQALAKFSKTPQDLTRILITHADIDHIGSLKAIQSQSGAMVWCSEQTAVHLRTSTSPSHGIQWMDSLSKTFLRPPAMTDVNIFQMEETLPVLGGLQILPTPGHTLDHVSFYSPTRGILFAGDALNRFTSKLKASPPMMSADSTAVAQSAIRLLELSPAIIACGHGKPLVGHSSDDLMSLFSQLRTEG